MKLWFENSNGEERVIADCMTEQEVYQEIDKFIDQCNQNKIKQSKEIYGDQYDESKVKLFKSYYIRTWYKNGRTHYDVGSHTEFFHWEGKKDA